ncbi:hypothetical protein DE146DRAFT_608776 [Phaeosphaeria sp. MPI-PUGE-AT-0046c]|nr:hypothetical protein DE146DRAFT_608776 [Phaeosphaeria sp. MPI-PUGE-AT-0046c]
MGLDSATSSAPSYPPPIPIPRNLTQSLVNANPRLRRLQRDLLVLTSFNETSTLHWRPSWFAQDPHAANFWTLYNPPNVVTELLPHKKLGKLVYTRRMRRKGDPEPMYIKSWEEWERVCELRGVPKGWLSEEMVGLMRMGLPRDRKGNLVEPPSFPMYPEPQSFGKGRYILAPSTYTSHLPFKFHNVPHSAPEVEDMQVVVVHSNGALMIEPRFEYFLHTSQWTHFSGTGSYLSDARYVPDMEVAKEQGMGRRWSWVPWTEEQEESCCGLLVKLKVRVGRAREGRGL